MYYLFCLAIALISTLFVRLVLRWPEDHPTQRDAWHRVMLCLYFTAQVKLLLDVDFVYSLTALWWIGFLSFT
jgi:hypothetical protein